jgi:hypothetical protein
LAFLVCTFAPSNTAFAQKGWWEGEPYIIPSNESGEISSAVTDAMRLEIKGERLFVIVRLGRGEANRLLNQVRLHIAKGFMLRKGFNGQTSVFALGEPVEGEGRIEFYIGSKLRLVTLAPRNKLPNLTCCEDYSPPSRKRTKR